jgi:hypothetical protein
MAGTTPTGIKIVSFSLAVAGPFLIAAGCTEGKKPDATQPQGSAAPSSSAPVQPPARRGPADYGDSPGSDELHPVYPVDAGPPDPLAQRLCDALYGLPARRAAECCATDPGIGAGLAGQCVRVLSYAMGQHAATVAPADVDACADAMTKATVGCDWVTPDGSAPVAPACEGIVKGALPEKAECRSSLECAGGMRCLGLSTIDLGTCGPAKPAGKSCSLAVDMLAVFTRQDDLDRTHPECQGYCGGHRCETPPPEGGACKFDRQCGKLRCEAGKCTASPLPREGEACSVECAYGLRCAGGKCAAPKAEGAACGSDAECRGKCTGGTCAKLCSTPWPPPGVAPPMTAPKPPPRAPARPRR